MRPDDVCVLWVSGRQRPGAQAIGRLLTAPDPTDAAAPVVEVELARLRALMR